MSDLIDREAALNCFHAWVDKYGDVYTPDDNPEYRAIEALPSADVQPVRHGHWLRTGRTNVYGGFEVECSVCNDSVMITNIEYEHYCRNCGARMDEGSE